MEPFKRQSCGNVDRADANASLNIALRPASLEGTGRLHIDRVMCKGSTYIPEGATP